MTTDPTGPRGDKRGSDHLVGFLMAVGVVAVLWNLLRRPAEEEVVPRGTPLPPLMAEGWLNTAEEIPTPENLAGRVVVVDCWASWCAPCRASMPSLAKLYAKYKPQGVEFVGLTPEPADELAAVRQLVDRVSGMTWPVGYGARPTISMLGVQGFPTLIVFDHNGSAVWSGHRTSRLASAIDEALGNLPRNEATQ